MSLSRAALLPPEVRFEYPFSGNLLQLGEGIKMHYLDEGQGPVVVLLHGNPTWSFFYRDLVVSLNSAGYRCIAPDHIGCGLSDKPQDYNYTLDQRITDVSALLEHLGIKAYSLVLHDWGGAIGCGLAGRAPDQLEKLVLLNTAAFCSKRIPLRIASVKIPVLGEFMIRGLNTFARLAANMAVRSPLSPKVRQGYLWPYRNWADRVAVWNFVKDIPLRSTHRSYQALVDVEASLEHLKDKPVRLLWGKRDFCFNKQFLRRWQVIFPQAETTVYNDCGHYLLEDGGRNVRDAVAKFLKINSV
ncbi:MAG: Haloalkane dehalogenase 2 [Opitutia bacterium UBA7350]|nr:MAG: Haloalkane dehalogenase 2 [Opitutae bacterium UBA7350]